MGELNLKAKFLSKLRTNPWVYSFTRKCWRLALGSIVELVRVVGIGPRFGAAKGFMSVLQQIRNDECNGRVILENQQLPKLPEISLINLASMKQNGYQPWPIFWSMHTKARLVGSSLALLDGNKLLVEESVYGEDCRLYDPSYNYLVLPEAELLLGCWTSLISFWYYEYYHWFTDVLTRLAPLNEFPAETKILVRGPLKLFQRQSLEMLGLINRVKETDSRHLILEQYYFSSPVGMTGCTNPYAVEWLRNQFLPHRGLSDTPRRFLIKRKGRTRGIVNQEELAEYLISKGWAAIYPEDLTLADQIACFNKAEAIIGEHGAAFTNLLWCRPGCKVLELCPDNFLNGCYEGIALCIGVLHTHKAFEANSDNSFYVPKSSIQEFLDCQH